MVQRNPLFYNFNNKKQGLILFQDITNTNFPISQIILSAQQLYPMPRTSISILVKLLKSYIPPYRCSICYTYDIKLYNFFGYNKLYLIRLIQKVISASHVRSYCFHLMQRQFQLGQLPLQNKIVVILEKQNQIPLSRSQNHSLPHHPNSIRKW